MNAKNNTLELLKLFASYMVVFIHILFYGRMGVVFDALARFAVPFFFLISGFYSYQITTKKIKKRIVNVLFLLIFAIVCLTIFNILTSLNINSIVSHFRRYADFKSLLKLFIFNVPIRFFHLWYFFAILYVYIIFYFVRRFRISDKAIFIISFSLLLLHILLGEGLSVFGIVLPISIVRNFALMGIPFFALGLFVKKYEHKFKTIPNYLISISIIIGIFEPIFSRYFFGKNELYIGSLFALFAIVCIFIKYSDVKYPSFLTAFEGCSTYIYIFHIMISAVIKKTYTLFGINFDSSIILNYIHPILVCIVSTAFAYFIIQIQRKFIKKQD